MDASSPTPSPELCPKGLPRVLICSHCQAENPPEAATCSTCKQPVVLILGPEVFPVPPRQRSFSLGSLMLFIALVAVGLGVFREAPPLGVLLLLLVTPAVMRTAIASSRLRREGKPMTGLDKFEVFTGTIALGILVGLPAIFAFGLITVATQIGLATVSAALSLNENVLPLAVMAGLVAAALVAVRLGFLLRHVGAPPDRRFPHDWRGTRPGSAIARTYAASRHQPRGGP